MPRAVRFDRYVDVDVLDIAEVERSKASTDRVVVRVVTAGTNPGETAIREGLLEEQFSATFPSGQGTDFAGVVAELDDGVSGPAVGTEVIGWSNERSAQAEFVSVPANQLVEKPRALDWDVARTLYLPCQVYNPACFCVPDLLPS